MIKDGRPYSVENGSVDDALITSHSKEEINIVCEWIRSNLIRIKTANYDKSSYSLKHSLETDTGIYLTNNEFKDAMLMCEYEPVNPNELNWILAKNHLCLQKIGKVVCAESMVHRSSPCKKLKP